MISSLCGYNGKRSVRWGWESGDLVRWMWKKKEWKVVGCFWSVKAEIFWMVPDEFSF